MTLFDSAGFMPHGHCYLWRPEILALHVGSDLAIGAAYYSIPLALAWFVAKRGDVAFRGVFVMFALFIVACGTNHFLDVWTTWHPSYAVEGLAKAVTASVSVLTALVLWRLMPEALALPSPTQLREANAALARENAERRQAQQELRQLNDHLEARIGERTRSLEVANQELLREVEERRRAQEERSLLELQVRSAQKLESLGVLAGGIAHDFNNLLAGVLGNASFALERIGSESELRAPMRDIELAAQRASELTHQMLVYAGRTGGERSSVDVSSLVREMADLLRASLGRHSVRYELRDDLPAVSGDAAQLRQVVMNLLMNAADATPPTSGAIRVATELVDCDAETFRGATFGEQRAPGRYVVVRVEDDGSGMDERTLARIFEPFFSTRAQGRGLGLAAVLGIVRSHSGAIRIESRPGAGTSATVYLPASDGGWTGADGVASDEEVRRRGAGRVLVVDDDPLVRRATARMLGSLGFEALDTGSGREALARFREDPSRFAAVLLDVTIPGESVVETLRALRRLRPDVPIVTFSGYAAEDVLRDLAGEAVHFLSKPFGRESLAERLEAAMGGG